MVADSARCKDWQHYGASSFCSIWPRRGIICTHILRVLHPFIIIPLQFDRKGPNIRGRGNHSFFTFQMTIERWLIKFNSFLHSVHYTLHRVLNLYFQAFWFICGMITPLCILLYITLSISCRCVFLLQKAFLPGLVMGMWWGTLRTQIGTTLFHKV